jgi:serine/threonine protein kinase
MRHTVVLESRDKRLEDFEKISLLGEGGFAMVFLVELKENKKNNIDKKYAMKQIPKKKLYERRVVENLMIEKKVLAEIKSNFIIALNFSFQDKQNCYFVM